MQIGQIGHWANIYRFSDFKQVEIYRSYVYIHADIRKYELKFGQQLTN